MCLTVMQLSLFAKDESETDTTEKGEFCCVLSVRTERKKLLPSITTITGNPVLVHMKVVACNNLHVDKNLPLPPTPTLNRHSRTTA